MSRALGSQDRWKVGIGQGVVVVVIIVVVRSVLSDVGLV